MSTQLLALQTPKPLEGVAVTQEEKNPAHKCRRVEGGTLRSEWRGSRYFIADQILGR